MQVTELIKPLDYPDFSRRKEAGLLIPFHAGNGIRVVDCGDDRPLTAEFESMIRAVDFSSPINPDLFHIDVDAYKTQGLIAFGTKKSPGRIFGGVDGLAITVLAHIVSSVGIKELSHFMRTYTVEGLVDFAADLSDRASKLDPDNRMILNHHSAHGNEGNPKKINNRSCDDPVGCAFAHSIGKLLHSANLEFVVNEAELVTQAVGSELPINEAVSCIRGLKEVLPENLSIHRGAILHAQKIQGKFVPVAMHEGLHTPNDQTALVIDMAGYKANARRAVNEFLPRYHHSITLPQEILPKVMPEAEFDPNLLQAISLLLALATRRALSGESTPNDLRIEIIPPEFAKAA
jgi:hypothetical protein